MNHYNIIKLGNPILRAISQPIESHEFGTPELKNLQDDLFAMMESENGLGLAAPQIGINKRAIVFGMSAHPSRVDIPEIPYTILFNPTFEPLSEIKVEALEGCLSVDDLRGQVPRYSAIRYRGFDWNGDLIERDVTDLHARVFQHELDHLDGIVFLDRVTDGATIGYNNELINAN